MSFIAPSHQPVALVNARLIDPASERVTLGGVFAREGLIAGVGADVTPQSLPPDARIVDCGGDFVSPGLIDMQAFVGEPGAEHRETIATATMAAAAGGVTTLIARADTHPPVDDPAVVDFLKRRARDTGAVRVIPMAALTRGRAGKEIAEFGLLLEAGAIAFGDAGHCVQNPQVMRRAMSYAKDFDALIVHFTLDRDLADEGVMNEGELASRLGLPGQPAEAESVILERDMQLVALTGGRYHAAMLSTIQSLEIIARAKKAGLRVTAGVSINHLTLNENDIGDYRTFLKLNPPLRSEPVRQALVAAVASGLIDVIVSDHDPQDVETKRLPFAEADFGAVGLETMFAAGLRLVHSGDLTLPQFLRALTIRPADILGLPQGRLAVGAPADLIRFDADAPFIVDASRLRSRCKNTPFDEARMQGRVKLTMVAGAPIYE